MCENFCKNGGTCYEENGSSKCSCLPNYYGTYCEYVSCNSESCQDILILANSNAQTDGRPIDTPKETPVVVFNQPSKFKLFKHQ